jgi:hypothetical protein
MSIKSNAFGGVTLSGSDAKKFKDQVTYGKPKAAAVKSIKRGVTLSRAFDQKGKISFVMKRAKAAGATG